MVANAKYTRAVVSSAGADGAYRNEKIIAFGARVGQNDMKVSRRWVFLAASARNENG